MSKDTLQHFLMQISCGNIAFKSDSFNVPSPHKRGRVCARLRMLAVLQL